VTRVLMAFDRQEETTTFQDDRRGVALPMAIVAGLVVFFVWFTLEPNPMHSAVPGAFSIGGVIGSASQT